MGCSRIRLEDWYSLYLEQPCSKGSAIPTLPVWDSLQLDVPMIWERSWVSVLPVQVAFQGIREVQLGKQTVTLVHLM